MGVEGIVRCEYDILSFGHAECCQYFLVAAFPAAIAQNAGKFLLMVEHV